MIYKIEWFVNVGTTKVKMANPPEQDGKLPEFVERRRAALERYLNRTAIHPIFQVDPDFRDFLESGKLFVIGETQSFLECYFRFFKRFREGFRGQSWMFFNVSWNYFVILKYCIEKFRKIPLKFWKLL